MEAVAGLLVMLVTIALLARGLARLLVRLRDGRRVRAPIEPGSESRSGPAGTQAGPSPVAVVPVASERPAPLAAQLHQLENALAPFAASSAHPRELCEHPAFQEAAGLLADSAVPVDVVMQYALGANWPLSCAALAALTQRKDSASTVEQVLTYFDRLSVWGMYFALAFLLRVEPRPAAGAPVVGAKDWWRDNPILVLVFREHFDRRAALGDAAIFGSALQLASASPLSTIRGFLERLNHPFATALMAQLDEIQRTQIDRAFLTTFGRFWTAGDTEILIEPQDWQVPLASAQATLLQAVPRSLLVSGDQLVGKTSLLRLLGRQLKQQGWTVFEASGADLMAGQIWFGQLEGRIRQATEQITVAKKVIWYIPDPLQLARSGTHQGQSASILDQILPAMAAGRLVVWTEASPSAAARLLQARPVLRSVIDVVRLEPESEASTLSLAHALVARFSDERDVTFEPACADTAVECARQYLGAADLPGSALQIIKLTAARGEKNAKLTAHDVLHTLSQLTGLPLSILDNRERIDLASIRGFFANRVMGQEEAVSCVIDRITMLKAGLNDPARPIGVFLFAGPTGTGKTELAKTTAEFLFGSVDRLIRLDMSEFQTADLSTLLGSGIHGETESLIQRVRKQPFSVVLLDEVEKAHPRIWDLFLQVFDAGRLTDTLGQVADFRHCLIILTSNLGATSHQSSSFGFAAPSQVFTADQVTRAIAQTYRPEFQNRLDKVIVFRPLSRDLMRVILRKELKQVLERRGLKDRAWAVEWEESALEFLLEQGFSPEMGARPLKRAIDQFVIAPLAATIVERRFPHGEQFVFFRSNGRAIEAEFVDPDSDASPDADTGVMVDARPPALASMILAPSGTAAELEALRAECASSDGSLAGTEWEALKQRLSQQMSAEEFWKRPERHQILARLALMDRVASASDTARSLRERLERGASQRGRYSRELTSRLALQLWLIKQGIEDVFEGAPIEVALAVEPALETASHEEKDVRMWCRELWGMYRGWAERRHMQVEEITASPDGEPPLLIVGGFGAHRVLSRECGVHIREMAGRGNGSGRATARVRMVATPAQELPAAKTRDAILRSFARAPRASAVVRRYRGEPSPLVRNADGSWRTGKLDAVLRGDFDLLMAGA